MEIRSVTVFCDPLDVPDRFLSEAQLAFSYPVQSLRLATPPFPDWWQTHDPAQLANEWQQMGIHYASLGPVLLRHEANWLEQIVPILSATDMLFASVEIADIGGQLDVGRCWQMAKLVQQVSQILPNGFGNLYLTAIANCAGGSPFFPVAYHKERGFALAVETAVLALQAIRSANTLQEARNKLVQAIEGAAQEMSQTAVQLAKKHNLPFLGIDFSLAPYPEDDKSLGGALEALGVPYVGASGSLFCAGFIADAINRAQFKRCGFSGLMLPVLEDSVLARRAQLAQVTLNDLLGYAAVCGVGLDTIPLAGAVTEAQLAAILLDLAMLASRANKPLTARLMPLPNLQAGDTVQFDFPYFADSAVMPVVGAGAGGLMQDNGRYPIQRIHQP